MKPGLVLRVLGNVMSWEDVQAHEEFRRLNLLASVKYDGYRDYEAGVRFFESLAAWLQQFDPAERFAAYRFVVDRLLYIGPGEMEKLVQQFYPNFVRPHIRRSVSQDLGVPEHELNTAPEASTLTSSRLRKTLFLGLSDGARVDYIRHQNVGVISNEQVVGSTQLDSSKWEDLLKNLREATDDPKAVFESVYLIDDFTATGTSFVRFDDEKNKLKGKICRFAESVSNTTKTLGHPVLASDVSIHAHHYVGTAKAAAELDDRLQKYEPLLVELGLPARPELTFGIVLPAWVPLSASNGDDREILDLVQKYYDPCLETEHTRVGGTKDMRLGYGGCALPLVLDHNTPNNSIPLIWAETQGPAGPDGNPDAIAMHPLFRRRQRHV